MNPAVPMPRLQFHPDWLVPEWPAPAHVRSVFTTRAGGVSRPPYDSLNLGQPSDDDPDAVAANRTLLEQALGLAPVYMRQVHGIDTVELTADSSEIGQPMVADAWVTAAPGRCCAVRVADCLPVLFTDTHGSAVAAAHAGWRGLANGVLEGNFRRFEKLLRERASPGASARAAERCLAWLGPCIGPDAFEVGPEVRAAFVGQDPEAARCFKTKTGAPGKWFADLAALARQRLQAMGITRIYGNDGSPSWCTVRNPSLFFSHRRDTVLLGGSGRMAACIWID